MDAVDEALVDLQKSSPVWNSGQFANHGPMVVEALGHLGRTDAVAAWLAPRRQRFPNARPGRGPIAAEWADGLGDFDRYGDWRALFAADIDAEPWTEVVDRWVGRLAPGFIGHLCHGVIRVTHAVRGLASHDNDVRRKELADALAYWAAVYEELPGEPPLRDGTLLHRATETYLTDGSAFPIYTVHGVTGAMAAHRLRGVLREETADKVDRYAAQACAWVADQAADRPHDVPAAPPSPEDLVALAVANGDEHAIKLVDTCVEAYATTQDSMYLIAATDGLDRFK